METLEKSINSDIETANFFSFCQQHFSVVGIWKLEKKTTAPQKKLKISESGLELIEAVQFDTTLRNDGVWTSNIELEDKAGVKDKIKAIYQVPVKKFRMKIRNIAGDEIVINSDELTDTKGLKHK